MKAEMLSNEVLIISKEDLG